MSLWGRWPVGWELRHGLGQTNGPLTSFPLSKNKTWQHHAKPMNFSNPGLCCLSENPQTRNRKVALSLGGSLDRNGHPKTAGCLDGASHTGWFSGLGDFGYFWERHDWLDLYQPWWIRQEAGIWQYLQEAEGLRTELLQTKMTLNRGRSTQIRSNLLAQPHMGCLGFGSILLILSVLQVFGK